MNAVIYARYSSDNQREESIEGQIRECTAYAERNGITVVRHYIDRALSAKTDNRPDFQQMIRDSNKKLFEIVLVWKFDRFARNRFDSANYKMILKKNNVHLISVMEVDSTVIPFTQFSAKSLGVDIEVVSSSKYVSGGATSLGGLVIDYGTPYNGDFAKRLYGEMLFNFGAYMTPQVAYMQTIGLETLDARYRVQSSNALELAKKLQSLPQIKRVNYVGLEDNPFHELAKKQFGKTAGAMICIDLEDKEACFSFLNHLKLIHRATNLFDNRSLAIHPASTIFGGFSERMRQSMDVLDTTVRLSVGLEDVDDLFEDIKQALE